MTGEARLDLKRERVILNIRKVIFEKQIDASVTWVKKLVLKQAVNMDKERDKMLIYLI